MSSNSFLSSSFNIKWHDIWCTDAIGTCRYAQWHLRWHLWFSGDGYKRRSEPAGNGWDLSCKWAVQTNRIFWFVCLMSCGLFYRFTLPSGGSGRFFCDPSKKRRRRHGRWVEEVSVLLLFCLFCFVKLKSRLLKAVKSALSWWLLYNIFFVPHTAYNLQCAWQYLFFLQTTCYKQICSPGYGY